jgi:2-oxoglutarate ferredoxin oxidoreductase subunit beta
MSDEEQLHLNRMMPYVREEILPSTFCSGCGAGTVLNCFTHAVDEIGLDPRQMLCVSGIGCSAWIPSPYFKSDTLHTTHGRPIAFATGAKIMKPNMTVVCIAGDGDISGIGGNHLIHAARRNIDMSVFMVNNMVYAMTGGQMAPTTPYEVKTTTTPHGNVEEPFQIAELVAAAGANYVARWTTYHVFPLKESMQYALQKKGFSFIEIISQCPENYGRRIGMRKGTTQLEWFKDNSIKMTKAKDMSPKELEGKILVGRIVDRDRPGFIDRIHGQVKEQIKKTKGGK